jgi:hypothetical protein
MRVKMFMATAAIAISGAFAASATAADRAETKVTIKGGGEVYGYVKSDDPANCAEGRKVTVFVQVGARGGGNDIKSGSDLASLSGDRYQWSIGNPGLQGEHIYAKARKTTECKADASRTVLVPL